MSGSKVKTITLVVGFDPISVLHDDIERAANEQGYELLRLEHIEPELIRTGELEEVLPNNIIWWRALRDNTDEENEAVWRWLDERGKVTINTHVTGGRIRPSDKMFQQEMFAQDSFLKKYAVPSYVVMSPERILELVMERRLKFPLLAKPRYGSLGKGIELLCGPEDLFKVREGQWENMVIEPYIESDFDWRVFVIGGKGIGAMRKVGYEDKPYDFYAKSAGVRKWKEESDLLPELLAAGERVARVFNLEHVGIDFIRDLSSGDLKIVEINVAGGWLNGFSEITGEDVASHIVSWFAAQER